MMPELFYKNIPESLYIENWSTIPYLVCDKFVHLTTLTFQCDFKCKTCLAKYDHWSLICEESSHTM